MDNIEVYDPSDELVHWGIKGMRWGQRRYQNKDGSLTEAGKRRLKAETAKVREEERINKNRKATQAKIDKLEARKKAAADEKKALDDAEVAKSGKTKKRKGGSDGDADSEKKMVKKSIKDMTDEELLAAVNRSRLEAAYLQLNPEPAPKQKFGKEMLSDIVKPAATNAGKKFVENALNKLGDKLLKDKVDPNSLEALNKMRDKTKALLDAQTYKNAYERAKKDPNGDLAPAGQKILWELENKKREAESTAKAAKDAEKAAAAKVKADEKARKANEAQPRAQYENEYADSTYRSGGQSYTNNYSGWSNSVSSLPSSSTTSQGRDVVREVLNRDGSTAAVFYD
jgi:hypothetical protein